MLLEFEVASEESPATDDPKAESGDVVSRCTSSLLGNVNIEDLGEPEGLGDDKVFLNKGDLGILGDLGDFGKFLSKFDENGLGECGGLCIGLGGDGSKKGTSKAVNNIMNELH